MRPLRVLNDGIYIYYSQLKWTFLILSSAPERYHEFIANKKIKSIFSIDILFSGMKSHYAGPIMDLNLWYEGNVW